MTIKKCMGGEKALETLVTSTIVIPITSKCNGGRNDSQSLHFISQYAIECVIGINLSLSASLSTMIDTSQPMDATLANHNPVIVKHCILMIMDLGNLIHSYKHLDYYEWFWDVRCLQ